MEQYYKVSVNWYPAGEARLLKRAKEKAAEWIADWRYGSDAYVEITRGPVRYVSWNSGATWTKLTTVTPPRRKVRL